LGTYVKKRREECVLFLDEGFSAESVAVRLRTAGFTVQRFPEWFVDENNCVRSNVEDPEVIRFCNKNGWLLVTRDHEMRNMHRVEIKKTEVAILATAHNSCEDQDEWVAALINLKGRILREFRSTSVPGSLHSAGRPISRLRRLPESLLGLEDCSYRRLIMHNENPEQPSFRAEQ
jgi:predicted nuclease of predicted toxin-antitoxin system